MIEDLHEIEKSSNHMIKINSNDTNMKQYLDSDILLNQPQGMKERPEREEQNVQQY